MPLALNVADITAVLIVGGGSINIFGAVKYPLPPSTISMLFTDVVAVCVIVILGGVVYTAFAYVVKTAPVIVPFPFCVSATVGCVPLTGAVIVACVFAG